VELEKHLAEHPALERVVVTGLPDERLGERVAVVAVLLPGAVVPTLEELRGYLSAAGVAKTDLPDRLEIAESIPTTPVGKIHRAEVRTWLLARQHT
jgi:non-ribosomal peptide synthetase component E (peptide arylation enzyme)